MFLVQTEHSEGGGASFAELEPFVIMERLVANALSTRSLNSVKIARMSSFAFVIEQQAPSDALRCAAGRVACGLINLIETLRVVGGAGAGSTSIAA